MQKHFKQTFSIGLNGLTKIWLQYKRQRKLRISLLIYKITHIISHLHRYSIEMLVNQALYQLVNCHLSHAQVSVSLYANQLRSLRYGSISESLAAKHHRNL